MKQYVASPIIQQRIANRADYFDPTQWTDDFYSIVWDVTTAQGVGLDIWGRIVGVSRYLEIPEDEVKLGFKTGFPDTGTFGSGVFYAGEVSTNTYALSDDAYRQLILIKALANISDTTIPALNRLLRQLFSGAMAGFVEEGYLAPGYVSDTSDAAAYVVEYGPMVIGFVFGFALSAAQLAILKSGVLPRPAGVLAHIVQAAPSSTFGFAGTGMQPFGQGTFARSPSIEV